MKKAQGCSKLFDSWTDITAKNGIAAAADHSRIKDLDKGILLVEMDHPGWKQILQTKQSKLLNDFRCRFPELEISGIALILGQGKTQDKNQNDEKTQTAKEIEAPVLKEEPEVTGFAVKGIDAINDEELKETLKKLGQTISDREKR